MIFERQIISRSAGPIFAIFSSNERVLGADDRSVPLFPISQETFPWQPISWKNGKLPTFVALAFRNEMWYHYLNARINSVNDASTSCANIVKFGPVTPELNVRYDTAKNGIFGLMSNISGSTGPIFVIFSPYESALRADNGSVSYIPICQGTLPWKQNNVAVMKANSYNVHSLHVRQMMARFCFTNTC